MTDVVRATYRVLSDLEKEQIAYVKKAGQDYIDALNAIGKSREFSIAITNMETSVMWAVKGITG